MCLCSRKWNESTCSGAAKNGAAHFEMLKWAHDHGCPWDEDTFSLTVKNGHFEILK